MNNAKKIISDTFKETIIKDFTFLKSSKNLDEAFNRGIPLPQSGGHLMPLASFHAEDPLLIEELATWRIRHADTYPSQFPVTIEGTKNWILNKVIGVSDRILFLILDRFGNRIGHVGFANCLNDDSAMEVDNVLRGRDNCHPGIMSEAMRELIKWSQNTLWPEKIFLRVMHNNARAIHFYERLSFIEKNRLPLRKHQNGDVVQFLLLAEGDSSKPDRFFVLMEHALPKYAPESLILTAGPSISPREVNYATDAARSGWNNQWNKYLKEFEGAFGDYVGCKYALATSSCTGALHIALAALGIGPGDEVIVPDITWVATANAVLYVGATPVFCDIHKDTWVIDVKSARSLITSKTKAIMPVHLYGHPCDMEAVLALAKEYSLYVVEDAAPSIGAEYHNQRTGSFGHFAAFSFQGAKLAVTGEGGMLVCNDEALYNKAYAIWDQGRAPGTFWIQSNGLKYKMSNIQAAIGLGQIQRNDAMVRAKRRIFDWYCEGLQGVPHLSLSKEPINTRSIYWMSSILLQEKSPIGRDALIAELKKNKIDTRPVFPAISQYPIWPIKQAPQPIAKHVGDNAINLPSGVCLKREEVKYVCDTICNIFKSYK
jgi:perosamine synthetase